MAEYLDDVVAQLAFEHEFITKALAVYEFIDEDGDRLIRVESTDSVTRWDKLGLLRAAQLLEELGLARCYRTVDELDEGGDHDA